MQKESQILKLDAISESLNSGAMLKAKLILNGLHPAEIARPNARAKCVKSFAINATLPCRASAAAADHTIPSRG